MNLVYLYIYVYKTKNGQYHKHTFYTMAILIYFTHNPNIKGNVNIFLDIGRIWQQYNHPYNTWYINNITHLIEMNLFQSNKMANKSHIIFYILHTHIHMYVRGKWKKKLILYDVWENDDFCKKNNFSIYL